MDGSGNLTVNGLYQPGADPLQFSNVMLKLTGTSSVTCNLVKFLGFGASAVAHFIDNSGSANITLNNSLPTSGQNGTHYILGGTGAVSWP